MSNDRLDRAAVIERILELARFAGLTVIAEADFLKARLGSIEIDAPQGVAIGCSVKLDGVEIANALTAVSVESTAGAVWTVTLMGTGTGKTEEATRRRE